MADLTGSLPIDLEPELRRYLLARDAGQPTHLPEPVGVTSVADYDVIAWNQKPPAVIRELGHDVFAVWWARSATESPAEGCAILPGEARQFAMMWPAGSTRSYAIQAGRVTHRGIKWTAKVQIDGWRGIV